MRAVIQRVTSASVTVDNEVISKISKGLLVLVGIGKDDTSSDVDHIANKLLTLHAFSDPETNLPWRSSVKDINGELLCVSQFTLFANTAKGKPDFHNAMSSEQSQSMYQSFLKKLGESYIPDRIQDGKFGAMMNVSLTNEGPVTFTIDSRKFEYVDATPPKTNDAKAQRSKTWAKKTPEEESGDASKPVL